MSVLMFINIKGGVAKTTNAVAVSQFLAEAGNRVLVIDADHQCAAGELLLGAARLARRDKRRLTLHDLMREILKKDKVFDVEILADFVVPTSASKDVVARFDLSALPCSLRIEEYHRHYNKTRREFDDNEEFRSLLDRRLRDVRNWLQANFDFTIIDCPPSLPIHVRLLVKVADAYVLPTVPDNLSVRGSRYLVDRLRRTNFKIPGLGTLLSLYREQNSTHGKMKSLAMSRKDAFASLPRAFRTVIPNATAIPRAMEDANASLNARYTWEFASLYRELVRGIEQRCDDLNPSDRRQRARFTPV